METSALAPSRAASTGSTRDIGWQRLSGDFLSTLERLLDRDLVPEDVEVDEGFGAALTALLDVEGGAADAPPADAWPLPLIAAALRASERASRTGGSAADDEEHAGPGATDAVMVAAEEPRTPVLDHPTPDPSGAASVRSDRPGVRDGIRSADRPGAVAGRTSAVEQPSGRLPATDDVGTGPVVVRPSAASSTAATPDASTVPAPPEPEPSTLRSQPPARPEPVRAPEPAGREPVGRPSPSVSPVAAAEARARPRAQPATSTSGRPDVVDGASVTPARHLGVSAERTSIGADVVQRVLDAVEALELAPPPRSLTIEVGDVRLRVVVEEGQVRLAVLGERTRAGDELLEASQQELTQRGFDLGSGRGRDRHDEPSVAGQAVRRRRAAAGLRL